MNTAEPLSSQELEARERANLASLVAVEPTIAGRELAPFSAGRLQLCRGVGLKLIAGGASELSQAEIETELLAFYFIHAFPLAEVKAACWLPREDFFARHIEPLSFEFPARDLPKIMAFLDAEFHGVAAANVEVEPKPAEPGTREAPPPPNS